MDSPYLALHKNTAVERQNQFDIEAPSVGRSVKLPLSGDNCTHFKCNVPFDSRMISVSCLLEELHPASQQQATKSMMCRLLLATVFLGPQSN